MAPPTRRAVPRKRPAQRVDPLQRAAASDQAVDGSEEAAEGQGANLQAELDQLLQEFESALREDPTVDAQTREAVQQQFARAIDEAALNPQIPAKAPDRAAWMDVVKGLQQTGAVTESEVSDLVRRIDQALEPLQTRESHLALEFSRRVQAEGQEKALAWFREAAKEAAAESSEKDVASGSPEKITRPLGTEIINSRSRRLRGPPRR
jgi:hypothetical protein